MQLSTLNFGILTSYWVDFGFSYITESYSWRIPVILQCIFLVPMLALLFIIPDTPRWLAAHGQADKALQVLRQLNRGKLEDEAVVRVHQNIVKAAAYEEALNAGSWKDLVRSDGKNGVAFVTCIWMLMS